MDDEGAAKNDDEFKVFCSNKDLDGSLLKGVVLNEWVAYNDCAKVWYNSNANVLPVLQQEIKKQKPGHLFIIGIYDWQYNLKPLLFCRGVKKIVSVRGMLHPGALSQKSFKKRIYLGFWKLLGLHKRVIFHATDAAEQQYIQAVFGGAAKVKIAANFPGALPLQPVAGKEPGRLKLVSVALLSPMKNILLVLQALAGMNGAGEKNEILFPSFPDDSNHGGIYIEYDIYGPVKDRRYWEECESLIKKLPPGIIVNYHGDIEPGKVAAALGAGHVFILPSKSENFGHSLYEALSAGRPVITSNNTPWIKLEAAKAGINVSPDDTASLQKAIALFAAMGQAELAAWSTAAGNYAGSAVDLNTIRSQYEEMFE